MDDTLNVGKKHVQHPRNIAYSKPKLDSINFKLPSTYGNCDPMGTGDT